MRNVGKASKRISKKNKKSSKKKNIVKKSIIKLKAKTQPPRQRLDHSGHLPRLNRVKGQVDGIERMINEGRYCLDIIAQLRAASSALKAIESEIFKTHLRGCVKDAFNGDDLFNSEEKIQEIIKLIY